MRESYTDSRGARAPSPKVLFVIADGARARLVARSPETGHFVTFEEVDARRELRRLRAEMRASPLDSSFESASPARHGVGREDVLRQAKDAFMADVADKAAKACRARGYDDAFVAAPKRLVGALRDQLGAHARIVGTLGRDLTKVPDAELGAWLDHPISASAAS